MIKQRQSGVELFKVIAIFCIVLSHVTQTLGQINPDVGYYEYVIGLGNTTRSGQVLILNILRQAGLMGDAIFFVCSSWFLIGKTASARKKAFRLICTVWTISILFLLAFVCAYSGNLNRDYIIRAFFPTCFGNNGYLTCYILFLFIYPVLNHLIAALDQRTHFRIVVFSSAIWIVADYINNAWFFPSSLTLWITIFFLISYLKLYCPEIMERKKVGYWLLAVGVLGMVGQVVVMNTLGLYFDRFANKVLNWHSSCSPFYIMIAIGGLIVALQMKWQSKMINYISGLSLFVYLIHENLFVRTYARPAIWQYIYVHRGYAKVLIWDGLYAAGLLAVSIILSMLYKETIHRAVSRIADHLYEKIASLLGRAETRFLKNRQDWQ